VALGVDEELAAAADFDASSRHGTQLVARLADLVAGAGFRPADIQEVYVSAGPGSFTGTRIGVTVARMLAQMVPHLRCVSVPSPQAVAEAARELAWEHLGVILDAREGLIHATLFARGGAGPHGPEAPIIQDGPGQVMSPADFLAAAARPITLLGEGLGHHDLSAPGVTIPQAQATGEPPHLPTARNVWRVGRRLAAAGQFTDPAHLLPIYSRKPEAERLWERRQVLPTGS
jgi:tRNA threonylcarbamoyladenosine biosynthesis protein TsaB